MYRLISGSGTATECSMGSSRTRSSSALNSLRSSAVHSRRRNCNTCLRSSTLKRINTPSRGAVAARKKRPALYSRWNTHFLHPRRRDNSKIPHSHPPCWSPLCPTTGGLGLRLIVLIYDISNLIFVKLYSESSDSGSLGLFGEGRFSTG